VESAGLTNIERLRQLADEFFRASVDPVQLNVTPEVTRKLRQLHPATLSEAVGEGGPTAWILLIPTTSEIRERFLAGSITERELLDQTPVPGSYEAVYLCSALVLPECRRRGIARTTALAALAAIRADHPIRSLFYWQFSPEGEQLARVLARETDLPLERRNAGAVPPAGS